MASFHKRICGHGSCPGFTKNQPDGARTGCPLVLAVTVRVAGDVGNAVAVGVSTDVGPELVVGKGCRCRYTEPREDEKLFEMHLEPKIYCSRRSDRCL